MTWNRLTLMAAVAAALAGCAVVETSSAAWNVSIPPASSQDVRVRENPCGICRGRKKSKFQVKTAYDVLRRKRAGVTSEGDSVEKLLNAKTRRHAEERTRELGERLGRIPRLQAGAPADYTVVFTSMLAPRDNAAQTRQDEEGDNFMWVNVKVLDSAGKEVASSVEKLEQLLRETAYVCEVRDNGAFVRVPVKGTQLCNARPNQMVGFHAHTHEADAVRQTCVGYGLVVAEEGDSVWIQVYNPDEARISAGTWVSGYGTDSAAGGFFAVRNDS